MNYKLKRYKLAGCVLASLFLLSACGEKDYGETGEEVQLINAINIAPNDYQLSDGTICLEYGQTLQLDYTVTPDDAYDKAIVWSSSNDIVASVSQTGTITAGITSGSCVVKAAPEIGFGPAAATPALNVKVIEKAVKISSITLSTDNDEDGETGTTVLAGETRQMSINALPSDHTYSNYTWTSSDTTVAKVGDDGFVTTLSRGTAVITAASRDGGGASGSYTFTVLPSVMPTGVVFVNTADLQDLSYGQSINLKNYVTLAPADATFSLIQWTSSDETVASVDNRGFLNVNLTIQPSVFQLVDRDVTLTASDKEGTTLGSVTIHIEGGRFIHNFKNGLAPYRFASQNSGMSYSIVDNHMHVNLGVQSATDFRQDLQLAYTGGGGGFMLSTKKYKYLAIKFRRPYYYDSATGTYSRYAPGQRGNKLALNLTPKTGSNVGHWEGFQQLDLDNVSLINEVWDGQPKVYVWTLDKHNNLVNATDAETGLVDINYMDLVIADVKAVQEKSYDIYWIGTFSSLEEIKAYYLANE